MAANLPRVDELRGLSVRSAGFVVAAVSALLLGVLVAIVYGHGRPQVVPGWVRYLPALNATLNATSATFLVSAYVAVRRRDYAAHARSVLRAVACSALFLASYLVYHAVHGDTRFPGQGIVRPLYFFVLISHIGLSAIALPLILTSLFLSLSGRYPQHRRLSRFTLPIWLYVSVTGVLVYTLLTAFSAT